MKRTLMQVYVKSSEEAVALYQKAFDAPLLVAYPNPNGGYMHSELDVYGQILAVAELEKEDARIATKMMQFCLHFGEGGEECVRKAYELLKEGANIEWPMGPCDFSPLMASFVDRFGVYWCLFV